MTRPTSGQLDHFSYSMYLDDKTEDPRRLHLPHLRLRAPPAGALRKAAQAAPVIAAAFTEIPAVREQLSEWLGRDVPAATGLAKELLDLAQSEAQRLGDNVAETARQTLQAAERKAKGAVKEAGNVVKETVKELDETVILAEHKAEELIHHKPPPPRRFRPWLVGTLGFAAVLAIVATRRWAARRRGPSMAGTRRARRNTPTIPPVVPSRESVLQRTPSQSSLTPIKVHKVEFQRVGVQDGAEWDSPDEQDAESPQVSEWEPGMGKLNPKTEYYQINSQQDSPREDHRNERILGA